jgi:hypothetical protein
MIARLEALGYDAIAAVIALGIAGVALVYRLRRRRAPLRLVRHNDSPFVPGRPPGRFAGSDGMSTPGYPEQNR